MADKINQQQLLDFLNQSYLKYNNASFIQNDPICIPHLFTKKEDIEIFGFFNSYNSLGQS